MVVTGGRGRRRRARAMTVAPRLDPMVRAGAPRPQHALLINPFYAKDPVASYGKHVLTPTLALTAVAAATPPGWRVACWDENLLRGPPPYRPMPQVVGITVHLTFAARAFALADWYRTRGALVVLGGWHVHACTAECAEHADTLAIGDGVQLWPRLLTDIDRGCLRRAYRAGYHGDFNRDPPPARHLLPRRRYLTTASLIASRGCRHRCDFCALSTRGLAMPYRTRDPMRVAAEWRVSGQPYAVFTDNNLGSDPAYLRRLCQALAGVGGVWSAAISLDATDDASLIAAMAAAGCTGVFIGFETLCEDNLRTSGKTGARCANYARRVRLLHEHGIQVNGSFVFGFDHDRRDIFAHTRQWIEEQRLECATFHILTPYPGTPLFHRLDNEGRILHRDWSRYDTAHVVYRPRHMTPSELTEGYHDIYRRLFSCASIWRRRPTAYAAVPPYLAMSLFYKRCNPIWRTLIAHGLVHDAWRPLVDWSRRRHMRARRRPSRTTCADSSPPSPLDPVEPHPPSGLSSIK